MCSSSLKLFGTTGLACGFRDTKKQGSGKSMPESGLNDLFYDLQHQQGNSKQKLQAADKLQNPQQRAGSPLLPCRRFTPPRGRVIRLVFFICYFILPLRPVLHLLVSARFQEDNAADKSGKCRSGEQYIKHVLSPIKPGKLL